MTLAELQQALSAVEPAAVLVPARVLETMLRQAWRHEGFVWHVPHRRSFIVDRQTLFRNVDQEELALGPDQLLPQTVILLAWPESDELERTDKKTLLRKYWQRLFHSTVHLAIDNRLMEGKLTAADLHQRIEAIGPVSFEEIRSVLTQEDYLAPEADERTVYIEFAAVFSELSFFLPHLVPIYFPSLHDVAAVKELLSEDFDAASLYERTRLAGASDPAARTLSASEEAHEYYWKLVHASDEAGQLGNVVRAAILRQRASRVAPPARAHLTRHAAVTGLLGLLDRLRAPLALSDADMEEWRKHLPALLDKADQGSHPVEAALLYDLQKVCLDNEREIYALDLVEWAMSGFKRPVKRPLPKEQKVRVTRTLRAAVPRLALARLNDEDRNQFANLLQEAVDRSEEAVRTDFRRALVSALHDVGLSPANPLEATAFHKVVEELIDRIIESGFITFSDLRDTLSRSSLKLPDLHDPQDFIRGDPLLRLDRRLGTLLDGVYRPSEFYLRWLERLTALNFGTLVGRALTRYVTVPALAALLALELITFGLYLLQGGGVIKKYDGATLRAPNMATLQEFLASKPGFVTQYHERLWGFWQGKLTVFREKVPKLLPAQYVTENWEGPLGRVTLAAPDLDTLRAFNDPKLEFVALDQKHDGFVDFTSHERFTGQERMWVFHKNDPAAAAFQPAKEIPWEIPEQIYYPAWVVLGFFFLGLLHSAQVRRVCIQMAAAVGRPLRAAFVDGPIWIVKHTSFKEIVRTWMFQIPYWYVFKPALLWGLLWLLIPALHDSIVVSFLLFALAVFFINSRPGQALGETVLQAVIHLGHMLRAGLIPRLVGFIVDLFKQVMHFGESLLFIVDEWLRFRGGDSRPAMFARAALSLLWFPFAYLIRFNIVVLIEPCLNPLKFPIVSIATKLMLPVLPVVRVSISDMCAQVMGGFLADAVSVWITFWLPDVFGFMVWEMKENWSLYRANRRKELGPVALGQHGETVRSLLQIGFHSGTIPKLFTRLRQAERQARRTGNFGNVRACQAALAEVEKAVHLFVTREFCELLAHTSAWHGPPPRVGAISLATNQIGLELHHADFADAPMRLEFENRGGQLVAGVSVPGWYERLALPARIVSHNALAVLFKLAGADQVREQRCVDTPAADGAAALPIQHRDFAAMPITWQQCVDCWQPSRAATTPIPLLEQSSLWLLDRPKTNGTSHKVELFHGDGEVADQKNRLHE